MIVFVVLGAALALFVWGRWRYDVVAMLALLAVTLTGVLPVERAFDGFAHPAVVTVAAVLVISRALREAGLVDVVIRTLAPLEGRPIAQIVVQTVVVAVLSAFMNNVGALALVLPVALRLAYRDGYSPAIVLMPLAFGSILGGLVTLIGTPPNLVISSVRAGELGEAYGMFAFAPVGGVVAVAGIAFVALVGWRLLPRDRRAPPDPEAIFDVGEYVTELRVAPEGGAVGATVREVEELAPDADDALVLAVVRDGRRVLSPRPHERIAADDILVVEADSAAIEALVGTGDLAIEEDGAVGRDDLGDDEIDVRELVVPPGSRALGRSAAALRLRAAHRVNLLGIARHGARLERRLQQVDLQPGDVMLLQGPRERLDALPAELGLLPLATRAVRVSRPRHLLLAVATFALAIAAVLAGLAPVHVAFAAAAVALVVIGVLQRDEPYGAIDWPVIVLLAAMIPVGTAFEVSGGSALVVDAIAGVSGGLPIAWTVALLMGATMMLSDLVNNAATAVLMAPLAVGLAARLDVGVDPLLMAVAIGASCAFLTPIGHQSNTLVLKPGGYRFGDYWRIGLPLEIVILAVGVPAILLVWPP